MQRTRAISFYYSLYAFAFSSILLQTSHAFQIIHRNPSTIRLEAVERAKNVFETPQSKGKILVLGGSGFLGSNIAKRAVLEGYKVVSLSRNGKNRKSADAKKDSIDYRIGDARDEETISAILAEGGFTAVYHCVGLLFDQESGFRKLNRFVSGSGSIPDSSATYDNITRVTAFNSISAAEAYSRERGQGPLPFIFISAAEVGWEDVTGGKFIESNIAPKWLKRYLKAKRAVEDRLLTDQTLLRPIVFRPSLIYSLDRIRSLPPVGAFFIGNKIGLPFVDRPGKILLLLNVQI